MRDRKLNMLARLSEARWQAQQRITFAMRRLPVDPGMLAFYMLRAERDPSLVVSWKCGSNDYIDICATGLVALAEKYERHLSACFAHERCLADRIDRAASDADLDDIAIHRDWPE